MRDPVIPFNVVAQLIMIRTQDVSTPEILLGLRQNTEYGDGLYSFPAGHVEPFERVFAGLVREMQEEIDMPAHYATYIRPIMTVDHLKDFGPTVPPSERFRQVMEFFFLLDEGALQGERIVVRNNEHAKCADLRFFPVNNLPSNLLPLTKHVMKEIYRPLPPQISSFGWDNPHFPAWRANYVPHIRPASSPFSPGPK
jgi:8-oxo-dGTP diphosphatase